MKHFYKIFMTLCIFNPTFSMSQNLVPNPSFELYDTCPYDDGQIYFAAPWFQPSNYNGTVTNTSSSDYYNACGSSLGVPNNITGYQFARTGNAYAGLFFYTNNATREYIEVKLLDSMIAGKKYCVEYYVSLAFPFTVATDDFHMFFSKDSLLDTTALYVIPVVPSVTNPDGNYITDTLNWKLVSGQYIANGGEKYLTIGNFYDNANTDTIGSGTSVYCYVEDVSVIDCGWSGVKEFENNLNMTIYPNPSNGLFNVKLNNSNDFEILIYSVFGNKIDAFITKNNTGFTVDLNNHSVGVYILKIKSTQLSITKKLNKL